MYVCGCGWGISAIVLDVFDVFEFNDAAHTISLTKLNT